MYSINFILYKRNFVLSLDFVKFCLFLNSTEIYKFKTKDSEMVASPLCLGNISKSCSTDNMKKQVLMDISMILV